jgi:glycosyltransferase involved in cell wall biosynthesis
VRILVVCQYYYPENFVITPICESLVRRGHEVFVVTGKPNYGFGKIADGYENVVDEDINGVHVHRLKLVARKKSKLSLIRNYLSFYLSSKRYLAHLKDKFDVVYSMSMSPLISVEGGEVYAKKHHVKCLIHCLDLWPESAVIAGKIKKGSLFYKVLYGWSRRIYKRADEILISSPSFASYFSDVLKLNDKKLLFAPQPPMVELSKEPDYAYNKKYNIVYAGNVGNLQLVENYVKAVSLLKDRDDFQFHIIGNGARLNEVKKLIKNLSLEDKAIVHPMVKSNEVGEYFINATALVVPLKITESPVSKTIPNKLVSSLFYAKPILATISGDGEAVLNKAGGSFFSDENEESIAKMIVTLFDTDPETLKKMGENNKKYFSAHFDFERSVDGIEKEIKEVRKS